MSQAPPAVSKAPASKPVAGWYPDPSEHSVLRYWNGAQWTSDVQPAPHAASPVPESRLTNRMALGIVVGLVIAATVAFVGLGGGEDEASQGNVSGPQSQELDVDAQTQVRAAQTAIETYSTDNGGQYTGATPEALQQIEPTLTVAPTVDAQATSYTLTIESESGSTFSLARDEGSITYSCAPAGEGACPSSGSWGP
jgi:hypothetical protein